MNIYLLANPRTKMNNVYWPYMNEEEHDKCVAKNYWNSRYLRSFKLIFFSAGKMNPID
jgi:hypothetical protein